MKSQTFKYFDATVLARSTFDLICFLQILCVECPQLRSKEGMNCIMLDARFLSEQSHPGVESSSLYPIKCGRFHDVTLYITPGYVTFVGEFNKRTLWVSAGNKFIAWIVANERKERTDCTWYICTSIVSNHRKYTSGLLTSEQPLDPNRR